MRSPALSTPARWVALLKYAAAAGAPAAFTALVLAVPRWPKPYSWQYLIIAVAVAPLLGIPAGFVALASAFVAVLWLGVPTPVHPGAEMFLATGLCLLALLHRWKMTTERLRESAAALQAANEHLREADRRKDEFIAVLSHELRNPLAPIRYAVPVLERERLSDAGVRAVAVIRRQATQLTRLVDDLLEVSRITSGQIALRREQVTLAPILTAAVEAAAPAIKAAQHELTVALPDPPVWIDADPARLTQVVTNILDNSVKYTPRGGRITLDARRDADHVDISVSDSGVGIPQDALSTVFDMFRQLDPPEDRASAGLGVGLALVKRLVEMHDGTVSARSDGPGCGSEFVIRLPVVQPTIADAPSTASTSRTGVLKVLVVDDNADLVDMLETMVAGLGHSVQKALDGQTAVATALSYRPDVVLLDLGLPVLSGVEVARELRRHPETAGARIVALTGWGHADIRRDTTAAGFDHHLTKPTDPDTLEQLLARYSAATDSAGPSSVTPAT